MKMVVFNLLLIALGISSIKLLYKLQNAKEKVVFRTNVIVSAKM